ncbi:hypothetical protein LTR86_010830 [Recurvomyces mirabilis]|nr:hypothetical protein LTR86_010830 [Recurvomyces mirabilis]
MNATVVLDQGGSVSYTNLDVISGKVIVRCGKSIDVASIIVKLEGESRTRLLSPPGQNGERPRPQLEYHKILYKVQTVFPPNAVLEGRSSAGSKGSYTLPLGQHEYPFRFKLPFNNTCASDRSQLPAVSVSGTGLEVSKPPTQHVKKTLPPTLSGFPGEAEIRYFVKATVARSSIFKENPRAYTPFNFFPIESPRPLSSGSEVYARQRHNFSPYVDGEPVRAKGKGIFGMRKDSMPATNQDAPAISVDARLPEPAILTCNKEIPLRILVKKLNTFSETVYLQSLQISLVSLTKIRAHEVHRTETNSWIIMSNSNMGVPLGLPTDIEGTEVDIGDRLWCDQTLPNTVAPSFETCNIARTYHLDIRVGLSYSGSTAGGTKPQNIALPLRLECEVFSGITPPPELLEAMAREKANIHRPSAANIPMTDKLKTEGRLPPESGAGQVPPTPMEGPSSSGPPELPARPGDVGDAQPPMYSEAPPSYEDAIASDLPPVNAPRPEYAPPPPATDDALLRDEKKG